MNQSCDIFNRHRFRPVRSKSSSLLSEFASPTNGGQRYFKKPFLGSSKHRIRVGAKELQWVVIIVDTPVVSTPSLHLVGGATTQWERGLIDKWKRACALLDRPSWTAAYSNKSLLYKSFTHIQHPDRLISKYGRNSTTDRRKWREHETQSLCRTKPANKD